MKTFPSMTPVVAHFKKGGLVRYGFQTGGLVRPSPEYYEIIPDKEFMDSLDEEGIEELRALNYELSGGEKGEWLKNYHKETEDARKYDKLQYWKDAMKFIPAYAAGQWKTLDPETGKPKWHFGHDAPPFEMVEMGAMTMDEWQEMKEFAIEKNKEDPFHPGIIDDLKSMAAIPSMLGMGEAPEFAVEASQRMEQMHRGQEELWDLDAPSGFPQHLTGALGTMVAQVPTPASATKGLVKKGTDLLEPITRRIPQSVKTATIAPRAIAGAGVEFFNPTITPKLKNYLAGAGFGGILGTLTERPPEDEQGMTQFFEENSMVVEDHVDEHWDDMDLEEKVEWVNSPYNDAVFGALSDDQYRQTMQEFEEAGLLEEDDAEQE